MIDLDLVDICAFLVKIIWLDQSFDGLYNLREIAESH